MYLCRCTSVYFCSTLWFTDSAVHQNFKFLKLILTMLHVLSFENNFWKSSKQLNDLLPQSKTQWDWCNILVFISNIFPWSFYSTATFSDFMINFLLLKFSFLQKSIIKESRQHQRAVNGLSTSYMHQTTLWPVVKEGRFFTLWTNYYLFQVQIKPTCLNILQQDWNRTQLAKNQPPKETHFSVWRESKCDIL